MIYIVILTLLSRDDSLVKVCITFSHFTTAGSRSFMIYIHLCVCVCERGHLVYAAVKHINVTVS